VPIADDREFDLLANSVKDSIEANQPEAGLDRLHTFVVKFVRVLAEKHNIPCDRAKPLHSVFGEYAKFLRQSGLIESDMAERILKSTIANFEAFSKVRNDRTLAHDNRTLDHAESILILNSVASTIRYIKAVERLFEEQADVSTPTDDDLPF
jgi:hypothetical protein